MKKLYENKLIIVNFDGREESAFVLEENFDKRADYRFIRALLQRTKETIFFNTKFASIQLLE